MLLAWACELTPEGIRPTADVEPAHSVTRQTGQKLNYLIIAAGGCAGSLSGNGSIRCSKNRNIGVGLARKRAIVVMPGPVSMPAVGAIPSRQKARRGRCTAGQGGRKRCMCWLPDSCFAFESAMRSSQSPGNPRSAIPWHFGPIAAKVRRGAVRSPIDSVCGSISRVRSVALSDCRSYTEHCREDNREHNAVPASTATHPAHQTVRALPAARPCRRPLLSTRPWRASR